MAPINPAHLTRRLIPVACSKANAHSLRSGWLAWLFAIVTAWTTFGSATCRAGREPEKFFHLQSVPFSDVHLTDPFWAPRIETNRTESLRVMLKGFTDDKVIENFAKTANRMSGNHQGYLWADSDIYKWLEGIIYATKLHPDPELTAVLNRTIDDIVAAQRADGYIDTYFQLGNVGRGEGGKTVTLQPWEDPRVYHEDYCMGHMMEAAIAHYQTTGKTAFLDVARKNADYLAGNFGVAPKRTIIPGHQEVELALFKLYKIPGVGKPSDLELAQYYLDERGRHSNDRTMYGEYCQDLYPIRNSQEPVGHGVRGPYMWSAAVDVAGETNDHALLQAVEGVWENIVTKKMYATGGVGSGLYNEGYAPDYDLSNYYAYNETCASCAMMFWSMRLGNLLADGKYEDLVEHELYNGFASGRSIDGKQLYYNNYMTRTGKRERAGIVCCATNIVRTVPSVPGYQYATAAGEGIWAHLYMAGTAEISYGGDKVRIEQVTNYPWSEDISLKITLPKAEEFALHLRIPAWAKGAEAAVNGEKIDMGNVEKGYLSIKRTWQAGDEVRLTLPMIVRRIRMNPAVVADKGRVAIARGPIVYCLESLDNPISVHDIVLPPDAALEASAFDAKDLGGIVRISGVGKNAKTGKDVKATLIPYAVWDNRTPGHDTDIEVMIPEVSDAAKASSEGVVGIAGRAKITYSVKATNDNPTALNDGILPPSPRGDGASYDQKIPRFTWWDHKGTEEWVAYEFPKPVTVSRSDILWYLDKGDCTYPESFRFEYWDEAAAKWVPVKMDADYFGANDLYSDYHPSVVRFTPVTIKKIRVVSQLKKEKTAGILEWRLL